MVRRIGLVGFLLLTACEIEVGERYVDPQERSASPSRMAEPEPAPRECSTPIVRDKELMITQRSVLLDQRPAWSFRSRMSELAGGDAEAFAYAWVDQWRTVTEVGPDRAPVTPRPDAAKVLGDPFSLRLLAIASRPDLRRAKDGCTGGGGELRFVYGASIALTVIVEIPWPATRTAREWIEAWHALGELPFGDGYNAALAELTTAIVAGSDRSTWHVRTNERAFGSTWEMRDFALVAGALAQVPIATTPRIELDGTASLDGWAKDNRTSIANGTYVLPSSFQAGAAPIANSSFRWRSKELSEDERATLSRGTCNGCHGGEHSGGALSFQHIAPAGAPAYYDTSSRNGETQLSRWLEDEELPRREASVREALCAPACRVASAPIPSAPDYRSP